MTIPNILTTLRLFLIPVFIIAYYLPYEWSSLAAAMIFWMAGFTDMLDGQLARRLKQTSKFGAFLDPVVDKVMVATALILITQTYASIWITIPALTMISREIIISGLREWMAEIGKRANVAVSWSGKVKTVLQMFALWVLIWKYNHFMVAVGYVALYLATGLTYWSMFLYIRTAKSYLFQDM